MSDSKVDEKIFERAQEIPAEALFESTYHVGIFAKSGEIEMVSIVICCLDHAKEVTIRNTVE